MSKYINRFSASLVLTLALIAGACSDKKADTLAEDTSLNRDLQMANQDTTAQPALQDVPATTEPATSGPVASAPATSPSRPRTTTTRTPPSTSWCRWR